jgi:hypothetical protein
VIRRLSLKLSLIGLNGLPENSFCWFLVLTPKALQNLIRDFGSFWGYAKKNNNKEIKIRAADFFSRPYIVPARKPHCFFKVVARNLREQGLPLLKIKDFTFCK